jgi:UDP:flavonoid glycosyltransferase YjiC (YdhE family)
MPDSQRIVLGTIGSLGDLHPCLALALELKRRGHRPVIASTEYYRAKVTGLGLEFRAIRPAWNPTDQTLIGQCESLKDGLEILYRRLILPHLRATYDDLLAAAADADLLIAGELVYAAPLVAETRRLPWVSLILSPLSFFSSHDPSITPNVPSLIHLRKFGRHAYQAGMAMGRIAARHWSDPVRRLRRELGLRRDCDPVFRDKFAAELVLAMFSPLLAAKQENWPPHTLQPGFAWFDDPAAPIPRTPELEEFLACGEPPIVFTQGSAAVHNAGSFYDVSMQAARALGRRGLLLGHSGTSEENVLAVRYAPYTQVFAQAAVIVHQGGSGTTGVALRAGRPMLVVPYGWDQPDNAARIERLGVGLHLARRDYTVKTATQALKRLLNGSCFAESALYAAKRIREEPGVVAASDAIESLLASPGAHV